MCGVTRREIPAAWAAAAKVSDSTRLLTAASIGEQPAAVAMGAPQAFQFVEDRLWQRHQPLLVALADDAQHLIGPVDGANLEGGGLADAQATRIHDGEAGLVNRVADTPEQLPDLIL